MIRIDNLSDDPVKLFAGHPAIPAGEHLVVEASLRNARRLLAAEYDGTIRVTVVEVSEVAPGTRRLTGDGATESPSGVTPLDKPRMPAAEFAALDAQAQKDLLVELGHTGAVNNATVRLNAYKLILAKK